MTIPLQPQLILNIYQIKKTLNNLKQTKMKKLLLILAVMIGVSVFGQTLVHTDTVITQNGEIHYKMRLLE